jgi:hypothetical protein
MLQPLWLWEKEFAVPNEQQTGEGLRHLSVSFVVVANIKYLLAVA